MASVEPEIIIGVLEESGELSIDELVAKVQVISPTSPTTVVKSAILPLISGARIDLTPGQKLRLRITAQHAL